jgi:hypothetical protein
MASNRVQHMNRITSLIDLQTLTAQSENFGLASAEAAAGDMLHRHVGGGHCVFYFRKGQASQRMPP